MAGERILFADDDEQIRKLVSAFLTRRGYHVELATDGAQALTMIAQRLPHLLITDVNMPLVNGLELVRRLRQDRRFARLPILMLSAQKDADAVLAGYNEGADEYVPKPIEMAVLAAKVETLLRRSARAEPVAEKQGRVIAFLHGKGGVGATTLAVNTALALASASTYDVALLDLALEFGNAALHLDIRAQRTLAHLAELPVGDMDDETFDKHVTRHESGVHVIAAPDSAERAELVSVPVVQQVLERLRRSHDYVVVDTPAHLPEAVLAALDMADLAVVVTAAHLPSLKATSDLIATLGRIGISKEKVMIVVSRTGQLGLENDQVAAFLERKPDAVVPFSPLFDEAADAGQPLFTQHPDNAAAASVRQLAAKIAKVVPAG